LYSQRLEARFPASIEQFTQISNTVHKLRIARYLAAPTEQQEAQRRQNHWGFETQDLMTEYASNVRLGAASLAFAH